MGAPAPGGRGHAQPDGTDSFPLSVHTETVEVGGFVADQAQTVRCDPSSGRSDTVAPLRDPQRHGAASDELVRANGPTLHLQEAWRRSSTGAVRGLLRWLGGTSHSSPARTPVAPEGPGLVPLATVDGSSSLPSVRCRPSEWVLLRTIALLRPHTGTPLPG